MPNMKRAYLTFTAYELIICVTPRATGSKLALSGKKQKTIPPSTQRCSDEFYSAKSNAKNFLFFFLKVSANFIGDECQTALFI